MKKETQLKLNKLVENIVKKQLNETLDPEYDSSMGFIYYFNIPFTVEDIDELSDSLKIMSRVTDFGNKQFDVYPMISITDDNTNHTHTFNNVEIKKLAEFKNKLVSKKQYIASRKDL